MNKALRYLIISIALLLGMYIYFMYRSQDTIVNIILAKLGMRENIYVMNIWHAHYPIPQWCMYSLPGGLWVFAATLLAKTLYFNIKKLTIELRYFPVVFAIIIECVQYLGVTDGMYDTTDLWASLICAALALLIPSSEKLKHMKNSYETYLLIAGYLIVFLSDNWRA